MIVVDSILEECFYLPVPEWETADEDMRKFAFDRFGMPGDSWATVATVYLRVERRIWEPLRRVFGLSGPLSSVPAADVLQLRVCSPRFVETDPRFLRNGTPRALVQEAFDWIEVERYCRHKVEDSRRCYDPKLVDEWENDFFVFDLDDD
ncbi:hypothetical protein GCM10023081_39700 [Arthrobacter ginkgonis]|uniref:Uncharacterized protein n=1 Tax=Arthrobacter ginkgonis TaxID=1630594 RepID=A0ABP7D528_9MICC